MLDEDTESRYILYVILDWNLLRYLSLKIILWISSKVGERYFKYHKKILDAFTFGVIFLTNHKIFKYKTEFKPGV